MLYASVFMYLLAWGFALYAMYSGPRWRRQDTLGVAVCVFLQSLCIAGAALAIVPRLIPHLDVRVSNALGVTAG